MVNWSTESAIAFFAAHHDPLHNASCIDTSTLHKLYDSLNTFEYLSLEVKLKARLDEINAIDNDYNFRSYNDSYQYSIIWRIGLLDRQMNLFNDVITASYSSLYSVLSSLIKALKQLESDITPLINDIFEHFKYGHENYVVFGKNGAGKTTLLNHISSTIYTNAVVIPANRSVESFIEIEDPDLKDLNKMLADKNSLHYLAKKIFIADKKSDDTQWSNGLSKEDNLYNIFSSLDLDRHICFDRNDLFLWKDDISKKYPISDGSDGEKTVAYIIMAALLAPKKAFFYIDEPEAHLNGALLRKLFDILESTRRDLCFIYFTHNTDFIESRWNAKLVFLEKPDNYKEWKFKEIGKYNDITRDILMSIEGNHDDIIYCEGNSALSLDYKILKCLYPDYNFIPAGSYKDVKIKAKGFNENNFFNRKAYGLIDRDYRKSDEIETLEKEDSVYTIGYNEIENLLVRSEIVEYVAKALKCSTSVAEVKDLTVNYIKSSGGLESIRGDFISIKYSRSLDGVKLKYGNLSEMIEKMDQNHNRNKTKIINDWNELLSDINGYKDYDSLVSLVSGKIIIKQVAYFLNIKTNYNLNIEVSKDDEPFEIYERWIVKRLENDEDFRNMVRGFLDISFSGGNTGEVNNQEERHNDSYKGRSADVLEYCSEPRSRSEIQAYLGISSRSYVMIQILQPLLRDNLLMMTIPDKPKSRNQRYVRV